MDKMEIALFADANEKWCQTSQIKRLADRVQLVNLDTYGSYKFPSTHPCLANPARNTTIDYCMCTKGLARCVDYATLTPYDLGSLGDHRGIIIDIDMNKLLGERNNTNHELQGRNLSTTNAEATKAYLSKVEEGFNHQNVFERTIKIFYHWTNKIKTQWEVMKKYEKLDKEIYNICRKAEKECKPAHRGKAEWSPALAAAIKELSYWRAQSRYKQENMVIKKLGEETGILYTHTEMHEIWDKIRQCRKKLDDIKTNSVQLRKEYLDTRAETYAKENNLTQAHAVRELLSHKSIKTTFLLLREKLKEPRRGLLQKIWIARDEQGNFIKDQQRVVILEKNKRSISNCYHEIESIYVKQKKLLLHGHRSTLS